MDVAAKIQRFIAEKGMSLSEFAAMATIPKSNLSELLNGNRQPTLSMARRAADAMGTTLDFLTDDTKAWPPPHPDQRTHLSVAEFKILEWAREVSSGDPGLEEARRRLLLIGYMAIPGQPEAASKTYGQMKAGEGPGSSPGKK